jgi:hypothetical protein
MSTTSLSIRKLEYNGFIAARSGGFYSFLIGMGRHAWVTSTNHDIRSLKNAIVIYFISFFEINERTRRVAPYGFWDSQVIVV